MEGLSTGEADRDQDGWVSLNELYDFIFDRVRERNPHQTPSRDVTMQGELYVARRRGAVTVPSPLPPELQEAAAHPLAGIRAGAVTELAQVAGGPHAGRALAARQALATLAADDSRTVSAAAAAALAELPGRGAEQPPTIEPPPVTSSERVESPATAGEPSARVGLWDRWKWIGVAVPAGVAVVVGLYLFDQAGRDRIPAATPSPSVDPAHIIKATAPWRVFIEDRIEGNDDGCEVIAVNRASGERHVVKRYGLTQFTVHDSGEFEWSVNHPKCLVTFRPGAGELNLPVTVRAGSGDTDAFRTAKGVAVTVQGVNSDDGCELTMRDAADGRTAGSFTVKLDETFIWPRDRLPAQGYFADVQCGVHLTTP